jgi:hypothetical protein
MSAPVKGIRTGNKTKAFVINHLTAVMASRTAAKQSSLTNGEIASLESARNDIRA